MELLASFRNYLANSDTIFTAIRLDKSRIPHNSTIKNASKNAISESPTRHLWLLLALSFWQLRLG